MCIENAKRVVDSIACTAGVPPRVEFFAKYSVLTHTPADFKNPDDPDDTSFEPHPENYPVAYLEYPNDDAQERYDHPALFYMPPDAFFQVYITGAERQGPLQSYNVPRKHSPYHHRMYVAHPNLAMFAKSLFRLSHPSTGRTFRDAS